MTTRRTVAGLGLGATALATCALLATGTVGGTVGGAGLQARTGGLLGAPAAVADELPAFADCARLRQWYVDRALPHVGPWGFDVGGPVAYLDGTRTAAPVPGQAVPLAGAATGTTGPAGTERAVGSSPTGTNVQEAGVDEPDTAKTDGTVLVRVRGRSVVVADVASDRPRELSRLRIPGPRLQNPELLLVGHTVLVLGDEQTFWGGPVPLLRSAPDRPAPAPGRVALPVRPQPGRVHLVSIDITDPAAPRVTSDQRVDGGLVSAREYGDGTVRAVLSTGFPPLDFVYPNRDRTRREARRENRRIVRAAPLDAWLPGIRSAGGPRHPLLGCPEVRHPRHRSGFGTISVLTLDPAAPTSYTATAVTAAGDLAYSSATRLYVATAGGPGTQVHAFALDGGSTSYLTSGTVPGTVRDRWSFSEYDGHLRVATALGGGWQPRENAVVVLDGALRVVGRVGGLGRGERIQSVRWFDDLAVLVTFRQTDPLYTLDLSSPTRPRLVGTLRIPGYSSYLHPLGGDLLLGVGQDATGSGRVLGAQAATFDLRDPRRVRRTAVLGLGAGTESVVGADPRAFTYLPGPRVALLPVTRWRDGSTRVVAVTVGADGSLRAGRSWPVRGWQAGVRALPLGGDRVALVAGGIRVLHVG